MRFNETELAISDLEGDNKQGEKECDGVGEDNGEGVQEDAVDEPQGDADYKDDIHHERDITGRFRPPRFE